MTRLHKEFGCTAHIQARGEEAKELQQEAGCKAQRWVLGQHSMQLSGVSAFGVCLYHMMSYPTFLPHG
jgi:hypothetical protein